MSRRTGFDIVAFLVVAGQLLAILILAAGMEWCGPREAIAGPQSTAACNTVRDRDRRHMCRAVALRSLAECGFIRGHDARHYCRALVRGTRTDCGFIRDDETRHECRSLVPG